MIITLRTSASRSPSTARPGEAPLTSGSSSDQITEIGARYERGELTEAQVEAAMEELWTRELKLPRRKHP